MATVLKIGITHCLSSGLRYLN